MFIWKSAVFKHLWEVLDWKRFRSTNHFAKLRIFGILILQFVDSEKWFCPFFEEIIGFYTQLLFLRIFGLSDNHTENCESFDFRRGSLACAISGNHIEPPHSKVHQWLPNTAVARWGSSERGGHAQRDVVKSRGVHLNQYTLVFIRINSEVDITNQTIAILVLHLSLMLRYLEVISRPIQ